MQGQYITHRINTGPDRWMQGRHLLRSNLGKDHLSPLNHSPSLRVTLPSRKHGADSS